MIKGLIRNIQMFAIFILAMYLLFSGMMKLVGYPGMEESFMAWGYGKTFMLAVAVIEVLLAIAVFAKPTRNIAFVGIILLMTGALYTHISNYEYEQIYTASWILVASVLMLANGILKLDERL